jgi:hypothetical protein
MKDLECRDACDPDWLVVTNDGEGEGEADELARLVRDRPR